MGCEGHHLNGKKSRDLGLPSPCECTWPELHGANTRFMGADAGSGMLGLPIEEKGRAGGIQHPHGVWGAQGMRAGLEWGDSSLSLQVAATTQKSQGASTNPQPISPPEPRAGTAYVQPSRGPVMSSSCHTHPRLSSSILLHFIPNQALFSPCHATPEPQTPPAPPELPLPFPHPSSRPYWCDWGSSRLQRCWSSHTALTQRNRQ